MDAIACACLSSSQPSDSFIRLERPDSVSVFEASMGGFIRHVRFSRQAGLDK